MVRSKYRHIMMMMMMMMMMMIILEHTPLLLSKTLEIFL
jgi:hypothetical protein